MPPKIQSISPCEDWYYFVEASDGNDIIFRVAAWAVRDDGQVVGMISASTGQTEENIARLVTPPPLGGMYLHRACLSEALLKKADEGFLKRKSAKSPTL